MRQLGFVLGVVVAGCSASGGSSMSVAVTPVEITAQRGATIELQVTVICENVSNPLLGVHPSTQLAGLTVSVPEHATCDDGSADYPTAKELIIITVGEEATLGARALEVEAKDPSSNDSAVAPFSITIVAEDYGNLGTNLLYDPSFEEGVAPGLLPRAGMIWQGDETQRVTIGEGITPHQGTYMTRFLSTGNVPGGTLSSQIWQLVDVRNQSALIATGTANADASAWFTRVVGDAETDRRFDIRILAFAGNAEDIPEAYTANAQLAVAAGSVTTAGATLWYEGTAHLDIPAATTVLLVEIYAYEDVMNDSVAPEFDGHYVDDARLTITAD